MGVSGLTTFLREGRNSLATSLVIERQIARDDAYVDDQQQRRGILEPREDEIPLVIDAWGFMWGLYPENLRWTTGGDYLAFSKLVKRFLQALDALHCRPYFVFDGPTPASKHDTVIQRYAGPLRSSLLFYRTSPQSRSHKSFLAHQPILPPFLVQAFVDTLKSHGLLDGVQIFHLPEGEADAYCVALADELEGFVIGNDSDFAILGAKAAGNSAGYKGYIPIEMMQWQLQLAANTLSAVETPTSNGAEQQAGNVDDGFQPVKSRKSKSSASQVTERNQTITTMTSLHLLPPKLPSLETISETSTASTLSLFLTVFTPTALATRLRIPPSYLPLFATILGTDHSPTMAQGRSYFFEDSLSKRDRVEVVARVIREALAPGNHARMRKRLGTMMGAKSSTSGRNTPNARHSTSLAMNAGDEAFSFVALVIGNLLARPSPNEDTFMELVTSMIEATCHYILPSTPSAMGLYSDEALAQSGRPNLGSCCSLFPFCDCSPDIAPLSDSLPDLPPLHETEDQQRVRRRYALARNSGNLTSFASFVQPDRVYLKSYLQDPEGICLSGLEVSKKIRAEAWRIFIANIYLFPLSRSDDQSEAYPEGDAINGGYTDTASGEAIPSDAPNDNISEVSADSEEFVLAGKRDKQEEGTGEDDNSNVEAKSDDLGIWITEYYRVGASQNLGPHDNSLFGEAVSSSFDRENLLLSMEPDIRQKRLLTLLDTESSNVSALEPAWQLLVALLRHAIRLQQASTSGNRKPWTAVEIDRIVEAAMRSSQAWRGADVPRDDVSPTSTDGPVLLQNRNVNIVAHVTAAGIDILALSQALLLPGDATLDSPIHHFLEGSIWHEALEGHPGKLSPEQRRIKLAMVQAVTEGFDNKYILGVGESNKPKRDRATSPVATPPKAKKATVKAQKAGHGRYDLLMDI